MIRKITMRGIKREDGEQELTGRDIVAGPNGSGKTTRAQALGIALLGYAPGAGKLPGETMKLARGDSMAVGIETEAIAVTREYSRKGGRIELDIRLDPPSPKGQGDRICDRERRIQAELGAAPAMLDFGEFLGLSDARRREFVYGLARAGGGAAGADRQLAEGRLRARLRLPAGADPMEKDILAADIAECMERYGEGDGLQEGLRAMLEHAKGQASLWRTEREAAAAAAQKMSEYKNRLAQTDRDLDADGARLEAAQAELTRAAAELGAADAENRRTAEANARIAALAEEIAGIEAGADAVDAEETRALIARYGEGMLQVDNAAAIAAEAARMEDRKSVV